MALYWLESWDTGNRAQLAQRYPANNLDANAIGAAYARTGPQGCHIFNTGQWFTKGVGVNTPTLVVGMYLKLTFLAGSGATYRGFLTLMDSGTIQLWLGCRDTTGVLQLFRGGDTANPLGSPSSVGLAVNSGVYIELVGTLHPTAGIAEVWVNGALWCSFAGNTRATANSSANAVRVGNNGLINGLDSFDCDDLYLADTRLGDLRVAARFPTAAGSSAQFFPNAGTNWQCVDEQPADDDTTFVSTAGAGNLDLYRIAPLGVSGTLLIPGVQLALRARKSDAGAKSVLPALKSGATVSLASAVALATSYTPLTQTWALNPNGNVAWSPATVDAAEIGQQVA